MLAAVAVGLLVTATQGVTMEYVVVGDPGNVADTEVMDDGTTWEDGTTGYGSVPRSNVKSYVWRPDPETTISLPFRQKKDSRPLSFLSPSKTKTPDPFRFFRFFRFFGQRRGRLPSAWAGRVAW